MRQDVQAVVRWGLPLLVVCVASGCGDSYAGAPVETPASSVSLPVESDLTTAPTATVPVTPVMSGPSTSATMPPAPVATDSTPPHTTAPVLAPPVPTQPPTVSDASVLALAAVLGVTGEIEHTEGNGSCVGRLEPRGLCVNVPIPGSWQYWDLDAQNGLGASDQEASDAALDVFARLGVDAGVVDSIEPNGPLPQVSLSGGPLVMVAEGGRIASIIAGGDQLPPG